MALRTLLTVICFALLGVCFVPMTYVLCPCWDVWVVDNSAVPQAGMTVRLSYADYSLGGEQHEQDAVTDSSGHVQFGRREAKAFLAERFLCTVRSILTSGVHASFGRHASVFAFGKEKEGYAVSGQYVTDWTGSPERMRSQIVVGELPVPTRKA